MAMDPLPPSLRPSDERPHPAGADHGWAETWAFRFRADRPALGDLRGCVRLVVLPGPSACWYWAVVAGAGRDLVAVVDEDIRPPLAPSLEIRAEGLWADHIVEEPFEHVSVACEAFGLRLDGPAGEITDEPLIGERVAFGLDLGWETAGPVEARQDAMRSGYAIPCAVVGEVLLGEERIELDAPGWREHRWGSGPRPAWPEDLRSLGSGC
jgi:hypothetical protein